MARHCGAKGLLSARMDSYHLGYLDETFDAVWSLNVLLHVPKASIGEVWREIRRVMKPGAIFFLGVYGGPDSEGPSDRDANEPKRFFSYFTDDEIQTRLRQIFQLISFERTELSVPGGHFQGLTLQKT